MLLVHALIRKTGEVDFVPPRQLREVMIGANLLAFRRRVGHPLTEEEDPHGKYRTRAGPIRLESQSGVRFHISIAKEKCRFRGLKSGNDRWRTSWY